MSIIDWLSFITGAICVALIVIERDVNWPIGIVNSAALLIVFTRQKLYAQVGLQAFYILEGAYGWWMWTRRDQTTGLKLVRIGRTRAQTFLLLALATGAGIAILYPIFRATGDPAPFADSFITVLSLAAEYMLCLKFLESWLVYLVSDAIALALFASMHLWIIFATYLCFTFLCIIGVLEWRRRLLNSATPSSGESFTPLPAATSISSSPPSTDPAA